DTPVALGMTMTSIPKADLLLATPVLTNATTFNQSGSGSNFGWAPQVVTNFSPSATQASIVATHYSLFDLICYTPINGAGGAGATPCTTSNLSITPKPPPRKTPPPHHTPPH